MTDLPVPSNYVLSDDADGHRVVMEWSGLDADQVLLLVKVLYRQVDAEISARY